MDGLAETAAGQSFRVDLAYTDTDLAVYLQIIGKRQQQSTTRFHSWGVFITGFIVGLVGGWVAIELSLVQPRDGALTAVFIFAAYWLGIWSSSIWSYVLCVQKQRRDALRRRWKDATVLVSSRGIAFRLDGVRSFYNRSAIKTATLEKGLLLLWMERDIAAAIPARLLEPAQQGMLLSLGREKSTAAALS